MELTQHMYNVLMATLAFLLVLCAFGAYHYWNQSGEIAREKERVERRLDSLQISKVWLGNATK